MPPATGHEIVHDIQDLFKFILRDLCAYFLTQEYTESAGGQPFSIDPYALAVAGSSAGGLCAYLAAMHANPKPRALLGLYAMGGNLLVCSWSKISADGVQLTTNATRPHNTLRPSPTCSSGDARSSIPTPLQTTCSLIRSSSSTSPNPTSPTMARTTRFQDTPRISACSSHDCTFRWGST